MFLIILIAWKFWTYWGSIEIDQTEIHRSYILTESRHRRIFKPIYQYCNFSEVIYVSEIGGYILNSNLKSGLHPHFIQSEELQKVWTKGENHMHISWILLNVFNVHGKGEEIFWAHLQYTEFLMKEYHQDPLYGNGRRKGWLFSSVLFCCWRSRDKRDMLFEEGFSQFVFRNERFLERDFFSVV